MHWDLSLFYALNNLAGQTAFMDGVIVFTASYLPYIVVTLFALYLLRTPLSVKKKLVAFGSAIFAALLARIGVGSPIRFFFPRERPFLTNVVHQLIQEHAPSFPSGHSLFFFAFSTVVYGYNKKLGLLLYLLTILICLARVAAGIHYPSDILAGAILGILCGFITLRFFGPANERWLPKSFKD